MATTTSTPDFLSYEDSAHITIIHYEPGTRIDGKFVNVIRIPFKIFGFVSTAAWGVAAFAPNTFNIPLSFRPWVFVAFIFWFFIFCAGFFNL